MASPRIQRALISVSDKHGLAEFASGLASAGVQLYSTGGTAAHLRESGLTVNEISQYTDFPELMDGRLKTLHPKVFGGLLCRHDRDDDMQAIQRHGIASFELVVVNLYPFEATVAKPDVTWSEAIEKIDIGGPSLVRAAAKNHAFVTIATSPNHYDEVLQQVQRDSATTPDLRKRLAADALARTASYDQAISAYFEQTLRDDQERFPHRLQLSLEKQASLRYGENPHQQAAVYQVAGASGPSLIGAKQRNGKELSYNNLLDLDAALSVVRLLPDAAAAVIKHNNPCGAASAETLEVAVRNALDGDPLSAFGSIVAVNRDLDRAAAEVLAAPGLFVEAILAPRFEDEAFEILTTKPKWRKNVRLMECGPWGEQTAAAMHFRHLTGGMLLQDDDLQPDPESDWQVVTHQQPDDRLMQELRFAWAIVRHLKSNAIAVTRDRALCGAGAGQMSRVDSVEISLKKAGDRAPGAVLASDAFFPFPDSIHRAAEAKIAAVIQPGGSVKDQDVIKACNEHQIAMVLTGRRHFKH